jgi:DNA repair protein RecN (Recombination protein N)
MERHTRADQNHAMLSLIHVRNYTVIDEVQLELEPGFSVITGETGAGKSILVDALGLALGDRADATTVRAGEARAEISVVFECPPVHPAIDWLRERSLDHDGHCVLRRVVSAEGRSRAFINNGPATLQDLRELGSLLVDIHGQHEHQSLLSAAAQRLILDTHGGHLEVAAETAARWLASQTLAEELERRRSGGEERAAQLELLRFQAAELESLALADGEVEALDSERNRLANVDRLASGLADALTVLYEADGESAQSLIAQARRDIDGLQSLDAALADAAALIGEAEIAVREAATTLARYRDRIEHDPERLEWIETRLARVRALAKRHKVEPTALAGILPSLAQRIAELEGSHESLDELARRAADAERRYFASAATLSDARRDSAGRLAEEVTAQLRQLGLPHGSLRVEIERRPDQRADAHGLDRIEFQVQINPGQPFGALSRVASGGELSRISLALEVVGAGASTVPTLVFDEVDAGIGGAIAEIVGARLALLARQRQVLCVTHLAQVASQGEQHYRVVKLTDGRISRTEVRRLGGEDRVEELSRMLGGVRITETARAHAAEMIERAKS